MRRNVFINIFILENFSVDVRVAFFTVVSSVISFPAFKLLGKTIFSLPLLWISLTGIVLSLR